MSNTVSRRALAKGAAWSIPVIAAAAAAPAVAASVVARGSVTVTGSPMGSTSKGGTVVITAATGEPVPSGTVYTVTMALSGGNDNHLITATRMSGVGASCVKISSDAKMHVWTITLTSPIPGGGTLVVNWELDRPNASGDAVVAAR